MKSYLPNAWAMTTGLPVESSFDRDTYNSISAVIDPATVAATLRRYTVRSLRLPTMICPIESLGKGA